MKIIEVLAPIILMMGIGFFCRRRQLLSQESIRGIKFLTTKIILPVAIFNALSNASYDRQTLVLVAIMLAMLLGSFAIAFLPRALFREPYRRYVPFMATVYEGGMMAYPLYTRLVGAENLSNIALLDISCLLFGFSIYMSLLTQTETGERTDPRSMLRDAMKNPTFIATVLGVIAGLCSLGSRIESSAIGVAYSGCVDIVTAPLSSIILVVVGYEIAWSRKVLLPSLKMVLVRFVLQAVMAVCVLLAVHHWVGVNRLIDLAVVIFMSAPATFSMQSFLKTEEAGAYAATTNSLYCLVSLAVYTVLAIIL